MDSPHLFYGLGPAPSSNPPGVAPQVLNPVFGAPGAGRDTRLAHETGVPFTVQLSSNAGTALTLPAGLDFVSTSAGTYDAAPDGDRARRYRQCHGGRDRTR